MHTQLVLGSNILGNRHKWNLFKVMLTVQGRTESAREPGQKPDG